MLALAAMLLVAACGGGEAADDGVASLSDGDSTASEADSETAASAEEAMLEWVGCMRDEGVNVPEPQVDAEGNMQFGIRAGGPGGGDGERINPEDLEAAGEVCGPPPGVAGGAGDPERQAELQDAALAFAQCMRDRGHDVPDPEVSDGRVRFGSRNVDPDDPEMQADAQECQEESFGQLPDGPAGASSGGGGETGNGS